MNSIVVQIMTRMLTVTSPTCIPPGNVLYGLPFVQSSAASIYSGPASFKTTQSLSFNNNTLNWNKMSILPEKIF